MDDALVEAVTEEIDEDEDVAKALYEAHTRLHGMEATWDWSKMFPEGRHYWRVLARGALAVAVPVIIERERKLAGTKVAVVKSWRYTDEELAMFRQQLREGHEKARVALAAIRQGPIDEGER